MKRLLTLTLLTLVFSFLPYAFVDAAAYPAGLVPCDGPECQACHFLQLGQGLITWFIGIMATLAALIVAFAGFKMLTAGGNSGKVSEAKSMMTNVVIGFIILLAAWIIVDTVMKLFVKQNVLRGPWYQIECVPPPPYVPPSTAGTPTTPGTPGTPVPPTTPGVPAAGQLTDAAARKLLSDAGVTVNKTAAQGTSLEGINAATIQDAIKMKNACGCQIIITGGTESGVHAGGATSHGAGFKYDMGLNTTLNNYITTNFTSSGVRSDGAALYTDPKTGNVYAKEGNHWDVLVKK